MIDANGTRFHLVYGPRDWPRSDQTQWSSGDATVRLRAQPPLYSQRDLGVHRPEERRGAARDTHGNWYWVGPDCDEVLVLGGAMSAPERFWPRDAAIPAVPSAGSFSPVAQPALPVQLRLRGLTVTSHQYLVVGLTDERGLLVFDLPAGGPPLWIRFGATDGLDPWELAATPDGGFFLLDRGRRLCVRFNRRFERLSAPRGGEGPQPAGHTFRPEKPASGERAPIAARDATAPEPLLKLQGLADPVALTVVSDHSVLVLDQASPGAPQLHRFDLSTSAWQAHAWTLSVPSDRAGEAFWLQAHALAFLQRPDSESVSAPGRLFVAAADLAQAFEYSLDATPGAAPVFAESAAFYPMRRSLGMGLAAWSARVYYDTDGRWVPLAVQPRPRFEERAQLTLPGAGAAAPEDAPELRCFDGGETDCVWHRLMLDASIPVGTQVMVESRAADSGQALRVAAFEQEPSPYLRGSGSELPFHTPRLAGPADRTGTWELLFQRARGRYLQLRVTLVGTGRTTPRVQALRAYYPRFSYSERYLPAVYRDDPESASFVERFLANAEGTLTSIEDRIAAAQVLFDPETAPVEYLEWLAAWLGVALDARWSESLRRRFIALAPQLFRERGTVGGVERALRMALDAKPEAALAARSEDARTAGFRVQVVERFLLRRAPGVVFGDASDVEGPGLTTALSDWDAAQGAGALHERFRAYLAQRYDDAALLVRWGHKDVGAIALPAVTPATPERALDFRDFVDVGLGFTYAPPTDSDVPHYVRFLRRRHREASTLNLAYGLVGPAALSDLSQASVQAQLWEPMRSTLPAEGLWLSEWIQFVSLTLPTHRNAHRFSVMVPICRNDSLVTRADKLRLAAEVTALAKPAHTLFEVKPYWAMFRVGEARLGLESIATESSRSDDAVIGDSFLGQDHLALATAWTEASLQGAGTARYTRNSLGRDALPKPATQSSTGSFS